MDLIIAFGIFITVLVVGLIFNFSTLIAMGVGLLCFIIVGLRQGFPLSALVRMALRGGKKSAGILRVFVLIGLITGLWRSSGVIGYFVHYGLTLITPPYFLIISFLLCCILGYALGTSFGIIGTVGVVLMTIAKSGGVNPALVAGMILSAAYFGDRSSPASSFLNLITLLTKTRLMDNVKRLFIEGAPPLLITTLLYLFLSIRNPLGAVDTGLLAELSAAFTLSPWLLLPAVLMIALPLLKVDVIYAMLSSVIASFILTITLQGMGIAQALQVCLTGFVAKGGMMASVFSGGGLLSMLTVGGIVTLSSCYSGIFEGTQMLKNVRQHVVALSKKIGRYPANVVIGVMSASIFCSQTLAALMSHQLLQSIYAEDEGPQNMSDLCNSTGLLSAMIPWCLALALPMQMMGVGAQLLPWCFYLYLTPLWYGTVQRLRSRQKKSV